jgi:hypothetical protein
MKNITLSNNVVAAKQRRGSTLVIVIALLGLLAFVGIVFFTFAAQERAASENFSEAAKNAVDEPPNVFDHMLRQVIAGPANQPSERKSILASSTARHSIVKNLLGNDIHPYSGEGVEVATISGLPAVDQNHDGVADANDWLEFVDSPVARVNAGYRERGFEQPALPKPPAPDVDYTYPDINNLFLAYKGWAVRDNGGSPPPGTPQFERVPVVIPSFHRPQYMKSAVFNGPAGSSVPTDSNWVSSFNGVNRGTAPFPARSFRPHPQHIADRLPDGTPVFRYLTDAEAASLLGSASGFPFLPDNDINSGNGTAARGEMGIWTGSHPEVYELDSDNDGDGVREGIWLDLNYPVQETPTGDLYVILHSVTVYDLDALIDVNVHGNLAALPRTGLFRNAGGVAVRDGQMINQFLSRSNLGIGPSEINPLWALRRGVPPVGHSSLSQFSSHFSRTPGTDLEQANMEWLWLLTGRGKFMGGPNPDNIFSGRWGEADRTYNSIRSGGSYLVEDLPRPGRSGNAQQSSTTGIRFGGNYASAGRNGFDDNQDRFEGEADASQGKLRAFGQPMDYAGTGRTHTGQFTGYNGSNFATVTGSPRNPLLHHDPLSLGPERWLRYDGYTLNRAMNDTVARYAFGQNDTYDLGAGASDDLVLDPFYDALFEDPLETIFDVEFADRKFDQIFGPQDLLALHLTPTDRPAEVTERLAELAPYGLENSLGNDVRERFTTLSSSLRRFPLKHDLGSDLASTTDDGPRAWEFSADADGADRNGDGYSDGDGLPEFPPAFGSTASSGLPYSATDPFRPQVRRLMTVEAGENRQLIGQLPLSINHILDVERNAQTPDEQNQPIEFLRYMQRAGLRFRPLTEHPDASEGLTVLQLATVPAYNPATPVAFPPQTPGDREFWARRDRQKMARDIYVLLYTIGGARPAATSIKNYTGINDPSLAVTDTTGPALYTHEQLRRMAQFAVNLVDAMDTDDVITKFEYDKNLGNGWDLDDDAFTDDGFTPVSPADPAITADGLYPEDTNERGVVLGVEAQQLAFSEVLGIRSPAITGGHVATPYDDDSTNRDFMFVELQNLQPTTRSLATSESNTASKAIWRLARFNRDSGSSTVLSPPSAPNRAVAFLDNADNVIDGGGRFTVSATSDTGMASSAFFVDTGDVATGMFDGTYELIAPDSGAVTLPTALNAAGSTDAGYANPLTDLDLIHLNHSTGRFAAVNGPFLESLVDYQGTDAFNLPLDGLDSTGGDFGNPTPDVEGFDLVLQRRMNPNAPTLNETDNPWVEVDRIRLTMRPFTLATMEPPSAIFTPGSPSTGHLTDLRSVERREPLDDGSRQPAPASPTGYRYNTVKGGIVAASNDIDGINSSNLSTPFQLWQAHFDRDFATPGELLSLPVVGPNLLTQRLRRMSYSPYHQAFPNPTSTSGATPDSRFLSSAAALLLRPDFPDNSPPDPAERARDNRWYRLFQFVEVPSRVHRMLGNYVSLSKVPGKLNLNTIRHWEVYAGLVDNPILLDREPNPLSNRFTVDRTLDSSGTPGPVNRDRWFEFLKNRDGAAVAGYDPRPGFQATRNFFLPGTAGSKPFRSHGYRPPGTNEDGSQDTILRTLEADVVGALPDVNRHWLEVGDSTQHTTPGNTNSVHQHQLLSKIMNNTTTVSNTFIVYSTAAYFEAIEDPPNSGIIRVGARIDLEPNASPPTNPGWQQRAVFLIDRSEAFEALDTGSGDFDWKRLVKSRVTIE